MVKAIILAGGYGKRLIPLTLEKPKPLIEIKDKPILQWQIEWLIKQNIKEIVLAVGYLKSKIFETIGDGSKFGVKIYYSVEEEPLGTGGAIKKAMRYIDEDIFIVLNGDIITNLSIKPLIESINKDVIASIALVQMRSPYGIIQIDKENYITEFKEKPLLDYLINAGIYVFNKEIYNYLPDKGDIEIHTFPELAKERKIKGVIYKDIYWKSIDSIKDIEEVSKVIDQIYSLS
jgi:NDP-sugar pyrophosphorylase family protein